VSALLTAPVAEQHARKQELTYSENERQLAVWRRDAIARRGVIELDVREPPARLTRQLLRNELLSMS
jgi:hypothetical protein